MVYYDYPPHLIKNGYQTLDDLVHITTEIVMG